MICPLFSFIIDAVCFALVTISVAIVSAVSISCIRNFDRICKLIGKFEDVHAAIMSFQRNGIVGMLTGGGGDEKEEEEKDAPEDIAATTIIAPCTTVADDNDDADVLELDPLDKQKRITSTRRGRDRPRAS
jgi:MFS superfamily sulfate permease-like transporter